MKTFTLSFLLAAISAAAGSSLRGDFETDADVADASRRNLQNCVANSSYLGCYEDRSGGNGSKRAMQFRYAGKDHSALKCESVCVDMGYKFFARQWKVVAQSILVVLIRMLRCIT